MKDINLIKKVIERAKLVLEGDIEVKEGTSEIIEGILEALCWVIGDISDEEFILFPRNIIEVEEIDEDEYDLEINEDEGPENFRDLDELDYNNNDFGD